MRRDGYRIVFLLVISIAVVGSGPMAVADSGNAWVNEDGYYADHDSYAESQYERTVGGGFLGIPDGSHEPGNNEATFHSYVVTASQIDEPFEVHYFRYFTTLPTADCDVPDVKGAGIDRGNNDTGTTTDKSLVNSYNDWRFHANDSPESREQYNDGQIKEGHPPLHPRGKRVAPDGWNLREVLSVVFAQGDAMFQDTVTVNPEDELVFGLQGCNEFPDQEGWYRSWFFINGTGVESGETVEYFGFSNWAYLCGDCDSRTDAVEKFGPPPGEGDGDGGVTTPTAEATPTAGSAVTATDTATATATPTQEATEAGGGTGETATSTEAGGGTPTESAATDDGGGGTPTPGDGAGFGPLVALVAVGTASLLVLRRRT